MDAAAQEKTSGHDHGGGILIKEEVRATNPNDHNEEGGCKEEVIIANKVGTKRKSIEIDMSNPSSHSHKQNDFFSNLQFADVTKIDTSSSENQNSKASLSSQKNKDDYELQRAKTEMGEVKEENQRLKMYLDQIRKEYHTLQMQYQDIFQQDSKTNYIHALSQPKREEPEFISLTLGRTSSSIDSKKLDQDQKAKPSSPNKGLSLGLDSKFDVSKQRNTSSPPTAMPIQISSSNNSSFEEPENGTGKAIASTSGDDHDEIISPQNNNNVVKKARVSVRARCDTPTMNDGCQWRKYGQKIAKGNPCPRAYYRCTVAPNCPVRKQVQRCSQDMSILITTYEGTHNHPLAISATAMASTTSAAATILLSGSSTSSSTTPFSNITTTTSSPLHGLNLYLSDNTKSKQLYFPNSPIMSSSPSSIPTITLDLTAPSSSSSSPFPSSNFNKLSSSYLPPSRFSSPNNLNFSCLESNNRQISWTNSGQLPYANYPIQPYNNPVISNIKPTNLDAQQPNHGSSNNLHQLYSQMNHHQTSNSIAAATKAITSDPSFQSALADALTSIIGAGPISLNRSGSLGENYFGQKLKWGDQLVAPGSGAYQSSAPKCGSSYIDTNRPGSSSNKNINNMTLPAGNLISLLPPSSSNSLPFSGSKSPSTSPSENIDHTN